jgi:uncharacterized protein (TIGR02246 family)
VEDQLDPRIAAVLAAWRGADAQTAASLFCTDAIYQEARKLPILGRSAIEAHFSRFFERAATWTLIVESTLTEGVAAAVAYRFVMAEADGPPIERPGCALVEFCDHRIHRWREYEG